jgi:hypothetical protein
MLWAIGAVLPARAGVQEHTLVKPCFRRGRVAGRGDDADAVCKERDAKGGARVEVLAYKQIAVV